MRRNDKDGGEIAERYSTIRKAKVSKKADEFRADPSPLIDAIEVCRPYDVAITIALMPSPPVEEVVTAMGNFARALCRANKLREGRWLTPLSISGYWIAQDLVQVTSDDHIGKPLIRCILLGCLNPAAGYDKAELVASMALPDFFADSSGNLIFPRGTAIELDIVRDPADIAGRFTSEIRFMCEPAVAIACFDQNGNLGRWIAPQL